MYDTLVLESDYIDSATAEIFDKNSQKKLCIDVKHNNTILYEFTNVKLNGSYDAKISIQVKRQKWVKYCDVKIPVKIDCGPYLRVECSIHKLLFATNVVGGIDDLKYCCELLIAFIEKSFNVKLQDALTFKIKRIDYAKNYFLKQSDKFNYFNSLNLSSYPRRKVLRFGNDGIYLPGSSTTVKIYDKYKDFLLHDKKRLLHFAFMYKDKNRMSFFIKGLENYAKNIIRFEVEIKERKLKYDLQKDIIRVEDITDEYINNIYHVEVEKLLKMSIDAQKIYNTNNEVLSILKKNFSSRKSMSNYNFWLQYTQFGEEWVRSNYSKSTFYRIRKELKNLDISLIESDLKIDKQKVTNFNPFTACEVKAYDNKYVLSIFKKFLEFVA